MAEGFKQQSYFSALARGGLASARTYTSSNKSSPLSKMKDETYKIINEEKYCDTRKTQSQSNRQNINGNKENCSSHQNQQKLESLMNGNNLQSLQEEISREEDDSTIIKFDIYKSDYNVNINQQQMKSLSQIDHCNYQIQTDDSGNLFDITKENSSLKMFDPQFTSSSQESSKSPSLKDQIEYNQQQKQKAKDILEQLRQSQSQSEQRQGKPVEQRLFEYQKKTQDKLEQQRRQKENQELSQLRQAPSISQKSNEIIQRKSANGSQQLSPNNKQSPLKTNLFQDSKQYQEELKRKEEARKRQVEETEMQGFTGKPIINKKSKSITRKLDDLYKWKEQQEKRKEQELQLKLKKEREELEKWQNLKMMNKESEKMLEHRYILSGGKKEKVQERLVRDASARQKKQQEHNNNQQRQRSKSQKLKQQQTSSSNKKEIQSFNLTGQLFMTIQDQRNQPYNMSLQQSLQQQDLTHRETPQQQCSPIMTQRISTQSSLLNLKQEKNQIGLKSFQNNGLSPISMVTSTQHSGKTSIIPFQYSYQNINSQMNNQVQLKNPQQQSYQSSQGNQQQQFQKINNNVSGQSQNSTNQKKKTIIYESLFSKVQKMNTSTCSQINEDISMQSRQSISTISPQTTSNQQNMIYQQIQKDSQVLNINYNNACQYNLPFQQIQDTQFMHSQQFFPQFNHMQDQCFSQRHIVESKNCQQPYQDVIIQKILENSYIPSGNGKEMRRNSFQEDDIIAYQQLNPINPNNQGQIMETGFNSRVSDICKNYNQPVESQQEANRGCKTQRNQPYNKEKDLGFMNRNNNWLENKKNKLEKAKEILEQREGRSCTFKPNIVTKSNQLAKQSRSKSKKSNNNTASPRQHEVLPKQTKEEGVQVNVLDASSIRKCESTNKTIDIKKEDELGQSSHTTHKINEAIEIMNFAQYCENQKFDNSDSLNQQCEISCLSPQTKKIEDIEQSNFDSESFMSTGNEVSNMFNRFPIVGQVKMINKKGINF